MWRKRLKVAAVMLAALLGTTCFSHAQQTSESTTIPGSRIDSQDTVLSDISTNSEPPPPGVADVQFSPAPYMSAIGGGEAISSIGSARPLGAEHGGLHLGPVYMQSVQFTQTYDSLSAPGIAAASQETSQLTGNLVFDKYLQRTRFALQYRPQLLIVNGQVASQLTNQNVNLDTTYAVSPRLSIGLSNAFSYFQGQNVFLDAGLQSDFTSGHILQGNPLNTPATWLADSIALVGQYSLDARTSLSFGPTFSYASSRQGSESNIGRTAGANLAITRRLNAKTEVGAYYLFQRSMFAAQIPNTMFNTLGGSFSQLLGATWRVGATLGASWQDYGGTSSNKTLQGSLVVIKALRRSNISLTYVRYVAQSTYLTNGFSDRVDAAYSRQIGRRLALTLGGGYYRELLGKVQASAVSPQPLAKYGTTSVTYQMFRNINWTVNWTYTQQTGSPVALVPTNSRNYVATGLQWTPGQTR